MAPEDTESGNTDKEAAVPVDQRLRAAREAQDLSVDQVALKLRLERDIVLALEAADYASLGAPVFVRGYLRSYARMLGLPEDEIAAAYAPEDVEPEEFRTRSMTTELKTGTNFVSFIMWVGISVIALGGLLYIFIDTDEPPETGVRQEFIAPEAAPEPEPTIDSAEEAEEVPPAAEPEPEPELSQAAEPAEVALPEPPAREVAAAAEVTLVFRFAEDCWAEVSDARRRLIYGLEQAGAVRTVEGVPPFRLFLGNVPAVELTLDGTDYDMTGKGRPGSKTARFSIDAAEIEALRD